MNDVVLNKISVIERCIKRIKEEYDNNPENLKNYTKQDSIILNIQRACEASIDLSMHIISERKFGIPQNSRDAFEILFNNKIIDENVMRELKSMVGFRNIAVHDYQTVNLDIVKAVIENHIDDLKKFSSSILKNQ
ncbi:type VII toxin-antitoxin system HepT family RNase toxin [Clostridium tyrobutyricum]|uniref:type VII toxin-antitoxin system HepT family RNase toxin n=1 Tax=Clostridium tyrobutyricum TaxID=1519 RepID=UPI0039F70CE4